jgi:hypothetical protein
MGRVPVPKRAQSMPIEASPKCRTAADNSREHRARRDSSRRPIERSPAGTRQAVGEPAEQYRTPFGNWDTRMTG